MAFIRTLKDANGRPGMYCSLAESVRVNGKPRQNIIQNFGFFPYEKVPYLKAAFNEGDPEEILTREKEWIKKYSESATE